MEILFEAEKYLEELQQYDRRNFPFGLQEPDITVIEHIVNMARICDEANELLDGIFIGLHPDGAANCENTVVLSRREVGFLTRLLLEALEWEDSFFLPFDVECVINRLNNEFFQAGGSFPREYIDYIKNLEQ